MNIHCHLDLLECDLLHGKDIYSERELNVASYTFTSIRDCVLKCSKQGAQGVTLRREKDYRNACWCEWGFDKFVNNGRYTACWISRKGLQLIFCIFNKFIIL